jgi:hypothetical protein
MGSVWEEFVVPHFYEVRMIQFCYEKLCDCWNVDVFDVWDSMLKDRLGNEVRSCRAY